MFHIKLVELIMKQMKGLFIKMTPAGPASDVPTYCCAVLE